MTHEHKQVTAEELVGRARDNGTAEVVFYLFDGTQALLTVWPSGSLSLAMRGGSGDTWGPPSGGMKAWHDREVHHEQKEAGA